MRRLAALFNRAWSVGNPTAERPRAAASTRPPWADRSSRVSPPARAPTGRLLLPMRPYTRVVERGRRLPRISYRLLASVPWPRARRSLRTMSGSCGTRPPRACLAPEAIASAFGPRFSARFRQACVGVSAATAQAARSPRARHPWRDADDLDERAEDGGPRTPARLAAARAGGPSGGGARAGRGARAPAGAGGRAGPRLGPPRRPRRASTGPGRPAPEQGRPYAALNPRGSGTLASAHAAPSPPDWRGKRARRGASRRRRSRL
jgi:hypothetical protein